MSELKHDIRTPNTNPKKNAKNFWQTLEKTYLERRTVLVAEKEQFETSDEAEVSTKEMEDFGCQVSIEEIANRTTDTKTDDDVEEEEFSDADSKISVDPGALYNSSEYYDKWMEVNSELEEMLLREQGRAGWDHRNFIRGFLLGAFFIAAVLAVVMSLIAESSQTMREPDIELCKLHSSDLIRAVFPLAHADDEV